MGKSSLARAFLSRGTFSKDYRMTVGVDLLVASVPLPDLKVVVELYLHDTGGLDVFREAAPKLLDGVGALMLVYDTTSMASFDACTKWIELVRAPPPTGAGAGGAGALPRVLVAAKTDLTDRPDLVPSDIAVSWAESHGLQYIETSAATGRQVPNAFEILARAVAAANGIN